MKAKARISMAWALLGISAVGWPLTALTLAKHEPQFILGLSWMAIIIEALNVVLNAQIQEKQ